jgi:hypothetical protein
MHRTPGIEFRDVATLQLEKCCPDDLRRRIYGTGNGITMDADKLLSELAPVRRIIRHRLVAVLVGELCRGGATHRQCRTRGLALGFGLCTRPAGALARVAYGDQPVGEFVTVAMRPLKFPNGAEEVFALLSGFDGRYLSAYAVRPSTPTTGCSQCPKEREPELDPASLMLFTLPVVDS